MRPKELPPINIDDYISQQTPEVQKILQTIRTTIKESVPEAHEELNHQVPAFRLAQHLLIFFAADEKIPGYNLAPLQICDSDDEPFISEPLKNTAAYPYDQPIPADIIRRIL